MCLTGVKLRLERENPLTFLEFNYMILQAYDFLELNRRFKCTLQLGGSDQWGNMVCAPSLVHSFPTVVSMRTFTPLSSPCRPCASLCASAAAAQWQWQYAALVCLCFACAEAEVRKTGQRCGAM